MLFLFLFFLLLLYNNINYNYILFLLKNKLFIIKLFIGYIIIHLFFIIFL